MMRVGDSRHGRGCFRLVGSFVCFVGVLLLSGCASPQTKGTPFYTGEYAVCRGPMEDRVNLWPVLYYRDPALSVLWPFIEKTEDHFAARYETGKDGTKLDFLFIPILRTNGTSHS